MKRNLVAFLLLVAVLLVSAQEIPLRQAWQVDFSAHHVRTLDNCVITLWQDTDAGDTDIYAQKINSSGLTQWPEPILLAGGHGVQKILACKSTSDHNFVFLYQSSGHNIRPGLFIQKVTSHGQLLWGDRGVQLLPNAEFFFKIILLPNQVGGAYVVYNQFSTNRNITGLNLDSFGKQLWPVGGILLASHSTGIYLDGAVSDGEGGFILNACEAAGTSRTTKLTRFSAEGTVIGSNPMLATTAFPASRYSILQDASGDFVLWNVIFASTAQLALQRMDKQGNLLLSSPQLTSLDILDDQYTPLTLQSLPDGGLMLSYKYHIWQEKKLMLARFDSNYTLIWETPVVQLFDEQQAFVGTAQLSASPAGGAWLSWVQVEAEYGPQELRTQYIDPSGTAIWGDGGIELSAASRLLLSPIPLAFTDKALFLWYDEVGAQAAVRRQVMDTMAARALIPGGAPLVSRLAGITNLLEVVATADKYLVFWADRRNAYSNIYYQLCDAAMHPLLEPEGRPLCPAEDWSIDQIWTQAMPDGSVAVLYHPYQDGALPYVQFIDSSGNTMYPDRGILVCNDAGYTRSVKMNNMGNELYILWTSNSFAERISSVKGQRISNGQIMWGAAGKLLISPIENLYRSLADFRNGYIVFGNHASDGAFFTGMTLKIDANGDPETGWPAAGIENIVDVEDVHRWTSHTAMLGDDLVIFSQAYEMPNFQLQRISAQGSRLWSDDGILFAGYNIMDIVGGEAISLIYAKLAEDSELRVQKISGDGSLLYSDNGHLVARDLRYLSEAKLAKFANGNLACIWNAGLEMYGYRDLFIRYLNAEGSLLGSGPELLSNAWLEQFNIHTAVIGNAAMVAWTDGRAGILDSEDYVSAIYATRINATPTSIVDPVSPVPAALKLRQNYPNPFNPDTNIAFELPESGTASLQVYNMKGQLVRQLYANQLLAAGNHTVIWDGCDERGRGVSSGIYLYRLSFADQAVTRKMLLAK